MNDKVHAVYFVTEACIGCKLCYSVCPKKCIDISRKPVVIDRFACAGCGRCMEICPKRAVQCMRRPGDTGGHVDLSSVRSIRRREDLPGCPVETTLLMIGDKWVVMILRDLMQGPRRFGELEGSLAGISRKVLSNKLKAMESNGLVERREFEGNPPKVEYRLTDLGWSLSPIMDAMWDWGSEYQSLAAGRERSSLRPRERSHSLFSGTGAPPSHSSFIPSGASPSGRGGTSSRRHRP